MGEKSAISYVDASWSPWIGCTKVSAVCRNCYAETWAKRAGRDFSTITRAGDATFYAPLKWKDPKRIFVCGLSDFFHPDANLWRIEAYGVMRDASQHTYLILTKRPELIKDCLAPREWQPRDYAFADNQWLGVTGETQHILNQRHGIIADLPAVKRFVSIEPMLGPIDITHLA